MRQACNVVLAIALSGCSVGAPPYSINPANHAARHTSGSYTHTSGSYTVAYSFLGPPNDGWVPAKGFAENGGVLYGTTFYGGGATGSECGHGCGTFYSFDPSSSQETVLYSFQGKPSDGALPDGQLLNTRNGFYGTTQLGGKGDFGTVFKLTPPKHKGREWTESILYEFAGPPNDGYEPTELIPGPGRTLYGVTWFGGSGTGCIFKSNGCGTVFELRPPTSGKGAWREKVLHSFAGAPDGAAPLDTLVLSRDGALFGATAYGGVSGQCPYLGGGGCGTIYGLRARKGSAWDLRILHSFNVAGAKPQNDGVYPTSLIIGNHGTLYGTTGWGGGAAGCNLEKGVSGCGTLFSLRQRGRGHWAESILYAFRAGITDGGQPGGLTSDSKDGFYAISGIGGTGPCQASEGCGTLLQLMPPSTRTSGWSDRILHSFQGSPSDGDAPSNVLLLYGGAIYATTGYGGSGPCPFGCGTIYTYVP